MSTWFLYLTDIIWHFGPKCLPDFYIWQILFDISVPNVYLISISDRYYLTIRSQMSTWFLYLTDIIPSWTQNGYLISISDRYNSILDSKWLPDIYIWQILFHYGPEMAIWFLYLTNIITFSAQNGYLIYISDRYYYILDPKWLSDIYIWQILLHFGPKMAIWYIYLTDIITFWTENGYLISISDKYHYIFGPKWLSGSYIWQILFYLWNLSDSYIWIIFYKWVQIYIWFI